jgi:hypothetical protein
MRDQIRQSNTHDANENLSQVCENIFPLHSTSEKEGDIRQLEGELRTLQSTLRNLKNEYQLKLAQMESRYSSSKPALMEKVRAREIMLPSLSLLLAV